MKSTDELMRRVASDAERRRAEAMTAAAGLDPDNIANVEYYIREAAALDAWAQHSGWQPRGRACPPMRFDVEAADDE